MTYETETETETGAETETETAKAWDILPFGISFAVSFYYVSLNSSLPFYIIVPYFYERTAPCFMHPRPPTHCPK